jgi:hypothetical protein
METTVLTPGVRMFMKLFVQGAEVLVFLFVQVAQLVMEAFVLSIAMGERWGID